MTAKIALRTIHKVTELQMLHCYCGSPALVYAEQTDNYRERPKRQGRAFTNTFILELVRLNSLLFDHKSPIGSHRKVWTLRRDQIWHTEPG